MSRNIKNIGKELLGRSLNSFHRKVGLTQLEKNNKMQDGILDGILSQVDDAYIEKTEQSNVIHLDGSGDGVVVLDSIEGNTMVNCFKGFDKYKTKSDNFQIISKTKLKMIGSSSYPTIFYKDYIIKPNTKYTLIVNVDKLDIEEKHSQWVILRVGDNTNGTNVTIPNPKTAGKYVTTFTTPNVSSINNLETYMRPEMTSDNIIELSNMMILEGDWTNKEIPPYFEGLQSSFEEKVNDEGKYEIEILMKNRNLFDITKVVKGKYQNHNTSNGNFTISTNSNYKITGFIEVEQGKTYYNGLGSGAFYDKNKNPLTYVSALGHFTVPSGAKYVVLTNRIDANWDNAILQLKSITDTTYIPHKSNKIKLLLNEPLRAIDNIKDRLCIKDGKLVVERRCGEIVFDGSDDEIWDIILFNFVNHTKAITRNIPNLKGTDNYSLANSYCDKFIQLAESPNFGNDTQEYYAIGASAIEISINNSKLSSPNVNGIKKWLQQNPTKITYELKNPVYEEVLNEHGEPILLEGYENGTLYIDSTIVPTTTVRYTPKMESFKTLKEVENNNIMLTNDVNDNIIPYMMDVDLMIMEKEMALMSHKNIRTIGVKDMTSMQKRTQDMLTRLIKGKTLTEQECKTRVVTYLDAGKITDAQADELMLLISEVYA